MIPPVPIERPHPDDEGASERVLIQDEPSFMAKLLKDGRVRLWLSNKGLGWLAFNFTVNQAITFREFLIVNTPPDDAYPNLFSNEGGEGSTH